MLQNDRFAPCELHPPASQPHRRRFGDRRTGRKPRTRRVEEPLVTGEARDDAVERPDEPAQPADRRLWRRIAPAGESVQDDCVTHGLLRAEESTNPGLSSEECSYRAHYAIFAYPTRIHAAARPPDEPRTWIRGRGHRWIFLSPLNRRRRRSETVACGITATSWS